MRKRGKRTSETDASMKQAVITYPDGFPQMSKMSDKELVEELRFMAAVLQEVQAGLHLTSMVELK